MGAVSMQERERERKRERKNERQRQKQKERERGNCRGRWVGGGRPNNHVVFGWFFVGDCFYQNNIAFFGTEYRFFLKRIFPDKPFFRSFRHTASLGVSSTGRTFLAAAYAISVRTYKFKSILVRGEGILRVVFCW